MNVPAQPFKTAESGWFWAEKGANNEQNAKRVRVFQNLPLGAQVLAVRYFTQHEENGTDALVVVGQDLRWARFVDPKTYSTSTNVVVEVWLLNWSNDHPKPGKIQVDWQ